MNELIYTLLVGAFCGWLAGQIRQGFGFGLVGNIIVGIVGSFVGSWLFRTLSISLAGGLVGYILHAVIGALIVLSAIGILKKA